MLLLMSTTELYQKVTLKNINGDKKKHAANFKDFITDLKSARKTTIKTSNIQMRIFQKYFTMGRRHCGCLVKTLLSTS